MESAKSEAAAFWAAANFEEDGQVPIAKCSEELKVRSNYPVMYVACSSYLLSP